MASTYCQKWFVKQKGWLLIVDNLDDDETIKTFRTEFLAGGMDGSILITSRNASMSAFWDVVEIRNLSLHESCQLLQRILGEVSLNPNHMAEVDSLIEDLGHLALAIDQAASFMQQQHYSVKEYRRAFETEIASLLSEPSTRLQGCRERAAVWSTWEISFRKLSENTTDASGLLLLLVLFHHENIPISVLEAGCKEQLYWSPEGEFKPVPADERWIPESLSGVFSNTFALRRYITVLYKHSFIRWKIDRKAFGLHPLDLLPPSAPPTDSMRLGEERTSNLWPLREYPQLLTHARTSLPEVANVPNMSETMCLQTLALLQTFGHLSAPILSWKILDSIRNSFAQPQPFSLPIRKGKNQDYLHLVLLILELRYTGTCHCRKRNSWCLRCNRRYISLRDAYKYFGSLEKVEPRVSALLVNIFEILLLYSSGSPIKLAYNIKLKVPPGNSWMESYAVATLEYYRLLVAWMAPRSRLGVSQYGIFAGMDYAGIDSARMDYDKIKATYNPSATFQKYFGHNSEEFRRSVWHVTSSWMESMQWSKVVQILRPLIQQSVEYPSTSWSHERCIIRTIACLSEMNKEDEARMLLFDLQEGYKRAGLSLRMLQCSSLLDETLNSENNAICIPANGMRIEPWQVFLKTLTGKTMTVTVNPNGLVSQFFTLYYEREGIPPSDIRLIFHNKQLQPDRLISEYGIGKNSTLHLVLRMLGGL